MCQMTSLETRFITKRHTNRHSSFSWRPVCVFSVPRVTPANVKLLRIWVDKDRSGHTRLWRAASVAAVTRLISPWTKTSKTRRFRGPALKSPPPGIDRDYMKVPGRVQFLCQAFKNQLTPSCGDYAFIVEVDVWTANARRQSAFEWKICRSRSSWWTVGPAYSKRYTSLCSRLARDVHVCSFKCDAIVDRRFI